MYDDFYEDNYDFYLEGDQNLIDEDQGYFLKNTFREVNSWIKLNKFTDPKKCYVIWTIYELLKEEYKKIQLMDNISEVARDIDYHDEYLVG